MRRRALLASAALLILPAFWMATAWAADAGTPPVKTPIQVTYYFLPG